MARLKEYLQNGGVEINSDVPAVESRDSDLVAMDMAAVPNIDDLQRVLQALKGAEVDETLMALKATELKAHCEHYDLSTKGQKKRVGFSAQGSYLGRAEQHAVRWRTSRGTTTGLAEQPFANVKDGQGRSWDYVIVEASDHKPRCAYS